jgi:hypothetical protein
VLLEVLLGGSDELDGCELEAAVLEAGDDGANEAALGDVSIVCSDGTNYLAIAASYAIEVETSTIKNETPTQVGRSFGEAIDIPGRHQA